MIQAFSSMEDFERVSRHDDDARGGDDDDDRGRKVAIIAAVKPRAVLEQPCRTFGTYSPVTFTGRVAVEAKEIGCSRSALIREFMEMGMEYARKHPKAFERRMELVKAKLARKTGVES